MRQARVTSFCRRPAAVALIVLALLVPWTLSGQAPTPAQSVAFPTFSEADAREWLTYLSSDVLQGRQVFTEGYGMAAEYVAEHLRTWKVTPMGDQGTYFQVVKRVGYRVGRNSSVTVTANGESRTFKQGDHVALAIESGGKQTLTFTGVEFAGYGITPSQGETTHDDFAGRNVAGKLVMFMPGAPQSLVGTAAAGSGAFAGDRADDIVSLHGAAAVLTAGSISAVVNGTGESKAARGSGGVDLTTVENMDALVPPVVTADDTFFEYLFRGAPATYGDIKVKADRGEPLSPLSLSGVTVTIHVDNTYEPLSTELTKNVVGMIEGTDPVLKSTYIFFGAHLDHVGYSPTNGAPRGRVNVPIDQDRIWNGADDDGSGSTAVLLIAKALATGPRPKRSVVVVWHAGEEEGLYGSKYMAAFPVVPLSAIQAEFNIDMIGRNRDDNPAESNTVYVIGADRISTDLHNMVVATDQMLPSPLKLDFEYNDANDPNSFYTRSDHYSYASKGIPIAFFFTGTHPDYHANTDSVDKILFPKLLRVAQMVYEAGFGVADSAQPLRRDHLGPRTGKGFQGLLPK